MIRIGIGGLFTIIVALVLTGGCGGGSASAPTNADSRLANYLPDFTTSDIFTFVDTPIFPTTNTPPATRVFKGPHDLSYSIGSGATTTVSLDSGPMVTREEERDGVSGKLLLYWYYTVDRQTAIVSRYGNDSFDTTSGNQNLKFRYAVPFTVSYNLKVGDVDGPITATGRITNLAGGASGDTSETYKLTYVDNETVTVPAGTFANCAKVVRETTESGDFAAPFQSTETLWIDRTVGVVKKEVVSIDSLQVKTIVDSVLTSATVHGKSYP